MKRKLPSYTLKKALEEIDPCDPYYTLERVRNMFPGKRKITARDVLKVPAKKFKRRADWSPGRVKCYAAAFLMPKMLDRRWASLFFGTPKCRMGSPTDVKLGLEACDMYENGELDEL